MEVRPKEKLIRCLNGREVLGIFFATLDPKNKTAFADQAKLKYWMPVDWYNGGMEHVTRHMIYSTFWNKFLYDQNLVTTSEPYAKRTCQGLILGSDGDKMSKSKGNVIDPIDVIENYGADTLRMYMLFIGEYDQPTPWNDQGVKGCRRFIEKVYKFVEKVNDKTGYSEELVRIIHKTIKDVSSDIEATKFNTAISKLMILSNEYLKVESLSKDEIMALVKLLNPFAPHVCEEINSMLGNQHDLVHSSWPIYDEEMTKDDVVEIAVQVNGKLRGTFKIVKDASNDEMEKAAFAIENVQLFTNCKEIKKIIVVKNKIVNIVAI